MPGRGVFSRATPGASLARYPLRRAPAKVTGKRGRLDKHFPGDDGISASGLGSLFAQGVVWQAV